MGLQELINSNYVLMLSKTKCKYCTIAKDALKNAGFKVLVVEIEERLDLHTEAIKITGQKTVPNIWVDGIHIGGSDKLIEKINSGEIRPQELKLDDDF